MRCATGSDTWVQLAGAIHTGCRQVSLIVAEHALFILLAACKDNFRRAGVAFLNRLD
jgi:hypothetical protein